MHSLPLNGIGIPECGRLYFKRVINPLPHKHLVCELQKGASAHLTLAFLSLAADCPSVELPSNLLFVSQVYFPTPTSLLLHRRLARFFFWFIYLLSCISFQDGFFKESYHLERIWQM